MPKSHRLIYLCYGIIWLLLAINPRYRGDWLLENLLVFVFVPLMIWIDFKHRYTTLSLLLIAIFAALHAVGSHYTYAQMEHFNVITNFFHFERNHFDRVVHFLFGLLTFRILFEMSTSITKNTKTTLLYTLMLIISISTVYEILEWLAAAILNPELGLAFLGTQGDVWDAQKDILVAIIGGMINILFYRHYQLLWNEKEGKK
ncbi:MAG: hypothetical protein RLZZ428_180 [Pseudomonadota bacterium]